LFLPSLSHTQVLELLSTRISAKELMLCLQSTLSTGIHRQPHQIQQLIALGGLLLKQYKQQKARTQNLHFFLELFLRVLEPQADGLKSYDDEARGSDDGAEDANHQHGDQCCHHDANGCDAMAMVEDEKMDVENRTRSDAASKEGSGKKGKRFGDLHLSTVQNTDMSLLVAEERKTQKEREKLLEFYLPSILAFFESLLPESSDGGSDDEDFANRVFASLANLLPFLLPGLKRFHEQAGRIMSLIRRVGKKYARQLFGLFSFVFFWHGLV
jgi:hypothetical protein